MSAAPTTLLSPRVLLPFLLVTLIWGSTWIVIKGQLGVVPPSWSVAYRLFVGSAAMFAYAAWRRDRLTLSGRGWGFAALLGLDDTQQEQQAEDRGIELKRELSSLVRRYPSELQRTRELVAEGRI